MKKIITVLLALFLIFTLGCQKKDPSLGKMDYPPEMDEWAKAAKLGPYEGTQDWNEIETKAKEEGEVIVYSSSSRIAKVADAFMAKYPEIKVTYYDLGSTKTVEKVIREQDANLYNTDIVTTGGSGNMVYEFLAKNRIVNFVPSTLADQIPAENKEPVLVRILEAIVFLYNAEANEAPPISNIWELTTEKYKGKVVIKNPLQSLSNFMGICTIVQHAEEMEAAYKTFTGEDIELHSGVTDAGYEFLYRLLHNDLVILKSGGKVAKASGQKGQEEPPVSISPFTYLRYNDSKDYVNALITPLAPVEGVIYPTYTAIARQAPHPNAAKLFTAFLLGDPSITIDMTFEKPYTEGKSLEMLQGLAPYFDPGTKSPRSTVPFPEGGEGWADLNMWTVDPEFMWYESPKVQDFWVKESVQ